MHASGNGVRAARQDQRHSTPFPPRDLGRYPRPHESGDESPHSKGFLVGRRSLGRAGLRAAGGNQRRAKLVTARREPATLSHPGLRKTQCRSSNDWRPVLFRRAAAPPRFPILRSLTRLRKLDNPGNASLLGLLSCLEVKVCHALERRMLLESPSAALARRARVAWGMLATSLGVVGTFETCPTLGA